jgi:hypothetical protein
MTALGSPMSIRATPARPPQTLPRPRGLRCTSSSCRKQNAGLSCCHDAGSWNDPSPGQRAAAAWRKDYERYAATLAGFHVIAFVGYMLKQAAELMRNA